MPRPVPRQPSAVNIIIIYINLTKIVFFYDYSSYSSWLFVDRDIIEAVAEVEQVYQADHREVQLTNRNRVLIGFNRIFNVIAGRGRGGRGRGVRGRGRGMGRTLADCCLSLIHI